MAEAATPDVSVAMVTHNSAGLVGDAIESLLRGTGVSLQVLVLDNASTDGSAAAIRERFGRIQVIESEENLGFGRGVVRAAAAASGRYLLLLNPDTEVLPGSIDRLVAFADENPGHGLYGGLTVDASGEDDGRSGWMLPSLWGMVCFGLGLSSAFPSSRLFNPDAIPRPIDQPTEVGALSGAVLLIRRELWEALEGFDLRYFMYSEDVDLCHRARDLGARPIIVPDARVRHEIGASSTSRNKRMMLLRGRATYLRAHWTGARLWWGTQMLALGVALRGLLEGLRGSRDGIWAHAWARRGEWRDGW